jgi:hypothetical protein
MPSSTHSNENLNSKTPASSPSSQKQGPSSPPSPRLSPLLRAEQAQDETKPTQAEIIRFTLLSDNTANDVMSTFSSDSPITRRILEIGNKLDVLIAARDDYLAKRDDIVQALQSLDPHFPHPYALQIAQRVNSVDLIPHPEAKNLIQQITDRHLSDSALPSRADTRPTPPSHSRLQKLGVMVQSNTPAKQSNSQKDTRPSSGTRRQATRPPQRRLPECDRCPGLAHKQTDCPHYYCQYCETDAPGHFAKYCARNPDQGIDRRHLSPNALAMQQARIELSIDSNPTPNQIRARADTILRSRQPHIPTPPNSPTVRDSNPSLSPSSPHNVFASGPLIKPILTPKTKHTPHTTRKNLGRLVQHPNHQLATPLSGRTPSNHIQTPPRPRSPTPYDADGEYEYDDVANYNMDGEGNF